MKINPCKSKDIRFTSARVKNLLDYSLVPEASRCKQLGIILQSDLKWVDQVNYIAAKAWKALRCVMCVLKKENRTTKSLAYTPLIDLLLNMGLHAEIHVEDR